MKLIFRLVRIVFAVVIGVFRILFAPFRAFIDVAPSRRFQRQLKKMAKDDADFEEDYYGNLRRELDGRKQ